MVPTMSRPTETEQELTRAVESGHALALTSKADNVLSAAFVRDLLRSADFDPRGLRVSGARIKGRLDLDFMTTVPLALTDCVLDDVSMCDAQIPAVDLSNSAAQELSANGLHTRHLQFRNGRCAHRFSLIQARVDGNVLLDRASVEMVRAMRLRVGGVLSADSLYVHNGSHEGEAVCLEGCDIGGYLDLDNAIITSLGGIAVQVDHARVGGMITAKKAILRGTTRAFSLIGSDVGRLHLTGAVLRSKHNSALCTDGASIRGDVQLDKIDAVAQQASATIRMVGTSVGSALLVSGLVRNHDGQAVIMHRVTAAMLAIESVDADSSEPGLEITSTDVGNASLLWPSRILNRGTGAALDLSNTKVGRELDLDAAEAAGAMMLNGLTYPNAPKDADAWLTMLQDHTFGYEAQPYQQLVAVHRAAGHEHTARKVLIAQQRDLRRRADPGNKLWHWFLGVTLGYGYRPSRAVAGLLITFLLSISLVWTAGAHDGLTPAKDRPADSCSPVNRISLAADLAIPLVKLGGTPRCELANGAAGQWATGAGWVVQVLGWSFATLSVAGFTGLVRKS